MPNFQILPNNDGTTSFLSGANQVLKVGTDNKLYDKDNVRLINTNHLFGFKNLLINGSFRVNQRGYVSGTATGTSNQYTLDRWRIPTSGQSLTFTGGLYTTPASGIEQVIENLNVMTGTYTLSFNSGANVTAKTVSQSSDNVTYTNVTANADGTYTLTGGLYTKVNFVGSGISYVQFEQGSIATPFEQRPIGLELAMCQRYYEKGGYWLEIDNGGVSDTFAGYNRSFQSTKRALPTISLSDTSTGVTSVVIAGFSNTDFNIRGLFGSGASTHILSGNWTASAEL